MSLWKEIKVCVPINIALVKYWGKRNEDLILPLNDSLSVTVDSLFAETSALVFVHNNETDPDKRTDRVTLNDVELNLADKLRFPKCFGEIRRLLLYKYPDNLPSDPDRMQFVIESRTNFPVSAGLASSAAGFAAIAFSLGSIFGFSIDDMGRIARLGSGSATRSVLSGLVLWRAGAAPDGADCVCEALASATHWPQLRCAVVVVSDEVKSRSSTDGMALTAATSSLMTHRLSTSVHVHKARIQAAFLKRDFDEFAEFVMRESNQLHAVCLDTYPPLMYLNDSSRSLIRFILAYNNKRGQNRLAYTFDAGPNCCIFMLDSELPEFLSTFCHYFPNDIESKFIRSELTLSPASSFVNVDDFPKHQNIVHYVVVSKVAGGPRIISAKT